MTATQGPMPSSRLGKLKWLSRRGMKELDVLLARFLAHNEDQLIAGGWPEFEALLQVEDDRLWSWLQRPERAAGSSFEQILLDIRDGATRSP